MKKQFLLSLFIILFPMSLVIVGVEIGFRWFESYEQKEDSKKLLLMYDEPNAYFEMLGTRSEMEYNPYLAYQLTAGRRGRDFTTNTSGFRYDENISREKPKDEFRIFVTGGSTAWGNGVRQNWLYTSVMEKLFQKLYPEKKIRVITAAVPGYCSVQERILVENRIVQFQPDVVIMYTGNNDTYSGYYGVDIWENHNFMDFGVRINGKDKYQSPLDPPIPEMYTSKTLFLIKNLIFQLHWRSQKKYDAALTEKAIPYGKTVETFLENIQMLQDLAKRRQFKLMLFLQPTIHATQKKLCDNEKEYTDYSQTRHSVFIKYNKEIYSRYRSLIPTDAKKSGYLFLDGDDALRSIESCLFIDNSHLSDRGNRYIGEYLVQNIVSHDLLHLQRP